MSESEILGKSYGLSGAFSHELIQKYLKIYEPKQIIIPEGDTKKEVYIILKGEVFATAKILTGYKVMAKLREGEIFGEMAFFDDIPRTATIIAKTKVQAIVLTPENFKEVFSKSPKWSLKIIEFLSMRISSMLNDISKLYN